MAVGYSSAGEVIAVGDGVTRFRVGDRVACGGTYAAHSERAVVPQNLAVKIPDGVGLEAAAFTTVGAIALHGMRLAEPQLGDVVAVIGLGLVGQMTAQLLKANGCVVLGLDLQSERTELARKLGTDNVATNDSEFQEICERESGGSGVDSVLVTADTKSNGPIQLAAKISRDRGRVVAVGAVGTNIPRNDYYYKELDFKISRSYGPGRYEKTYEEDGVDYPIGYVRWTENRNMAAFLETVRRGTTDVGSLITHRFPIESGPEAYDLITGKAGPPSLGVLLTYPAAHDVTAIAQRIDFPSTDAVGTRGDVRLSVLGAGNFLTATMLPALQDIEHLSLSGIASRGGLTARHAADKYGFRFCASDESEVIADTNTDAVLIGTPHNLHAVQVTTALGAGKHVYCEKPLCLNEAELQSIVQALSGSQHLLHVGFNRRFSELGRRMGELARRSPGPLVMHYWVNAGALPDDHWLLDPHVGGGRIIGEGCHFIDFLSYLSGAEPISVQALGTGTHRTSDQDVSISIKFGDGSLGTVTYASVGDKAAVKERVQVMGGGSLMVLEDFRELKAFDQGKRSNSRIRFRQDKGHGASVAAFVEAIRRGGGPPIPYREIVATTLATFAAVRALASGATIPVGTDDLLQTGLPVVDEH
jgi:predicted dehydrogenase